VLQIALPVLCTLFVWWFSTGLVLYLVSSPQRTYRWSLIGATATLCVALWGLSTSATDATANGAYTAFCCAIAAWGWQEICLLTGVAMGPQTDPCPPGLRGFKRVSAAIQVILFHELQLLALGAAVALVTLEGTNRVGLWTYLILWTMRLSAKFNLFLGVPFLHDDWLPAHLRYVKTYFRVRPMNLLFPVAVSAATIVAFILVQAALGSDVTPADTTGRLLLASLLGLAVLEHWFMVLPMPVAALWSKFRSRRAVPRHSNKKATAIVFPTPTANGG
jgi:putative photosynthetic complex assembly protein 2